MVSVCDMIMGAGKSSACIEYMNSHPEKKFIYIAPYLDEAKRIRDSCYDLQFYLPSKANEDTHHSKTCDTLAQIRNGRNIASTHEAFAYYTPEMIDVIRQCHYTLMIDESVNVLDQDNAYPGNVQVLLEAGYIKTSDGKSYEITEKEYPGTDQKEFIRRLKSRRMYHVDGDQYKSHYFFWVLPSEFLLAFDDVIIMTYIFHGQDMYALMKMDGVEFKYISVLHDENGYHFSDTPCPLPEYTRDLKDMIHIFDNDSLNSIGEDRSDLSMRWFGSVKNRDQLRRNMNQYFRYYMKSYGKKERLYGTYSDMIDKISDRATKECGLRFNARATNDYSDKHVLVYAANVFYDGGRRKFFKDHGVTINEDLYALSTMIQWIWRSAIRNGEEIWIYIPSRRMRELLQGWLDDLAKEGTGATPPAERGCGADGEGLLPMLVERELRFREAV